MPISSSFILYLAAFVMGGCGLAYEYTLSRVAADLLGNSARQWALVIGAMMFCMGIGADLQKRLSDRQLLDKFIAAEIVLGLLGGAGPLLLLFTYGLAYEYYVLVQYAFICAIGLLLGFELPLIARLNEQYTGELKVNLGKVLKMDYIGSLAGALVWVFLLPRFFTLIETGFILGLLNLCAAAVLLAWFRKRVERRRVLLLALSGAVLLLGGGLFQARSWTTSAEQYLYRDRILLSRTTRYQHIVLTRSAAGELNCYLNGNLQFSSSDEEIYHENLVHPVMSIAPCRRRVLILGGGDGLAAREVLKYPDVKELVLCDLDPEMTRLAREHPDFLRLNQSSLKDARVKILAGHALIPTNKQEEVRIVNQNRRGGPAPETATVAKVSIVNLDAAKLLEQLAGRFDVIIIDFPDPNNGQLAKLYSRTFYRRLAQRLTYDGLFVQQATSPVHAKEAFLCIGRTIQAAGLSALPYHDNVPAFGEWGWWLGGRAAVWSPARLRQALNHIEKLTVPTRYLTPALIRAGLAFGKNQLHTPETRLNTLVNHAVYDYYLQGWQNY
jgi:spermidine synthase